MTTLTEAQQKDQLIEERMREQHRRELKIHAARFTYMWLGAGYSEESLLPLTFANFNSHNQPDAFEAAVTFANNPRGTLILNGPAGTGKTHLLAAIAAALHENNRTVLYAKFYRLIGRCWAVMKEPDALEAIIELAANTSILLLDELDKAADREAIQRIALDIIDRRWQARKPHVIATNDMHRIVDVLGDPVISRLMHHSTVVNMQPGDYREDPQCL